MKKKGEYPIYLSLGEEFTSVLSSKEKIYTFHADDINTSEKADIHGHIYSIVNCDRAAYLIKTDSSVYVWGHNYNNFI